MQKILALATCLTGLSLLSGCTGLGDGCLTSHDCPGAEACVSGSCRATIFERCQSKSDCLAGDMCQGGQCLPDCEVHGCPAEESCNNHQCVSIALAPTSSAVAGSGSSAGVGGSGSGSGSSGSGSTGGGSGTSVLNQQCSSDAACNQGKTGTGIVCSNVTNSCIVGCHTNSDCPSGEGCVQGAGSWSCQATASSTGGSSTTGTSTSGGSTGTTTSGGSTGSTTGSGGSVYCAACQSNSDCGGASNYCVTESNGNFCGTDCSAKQSCPSGSSCMQIQDSSSGNVVGSNCLPTSSSC